MARYSQIIGPTADFTLPASNQLIPGMLLSRFWDEGELLILYTLQRFNGSAGLVTAILFPLVDATSLTPRSPFFDATAGGLMQISGAALFPIASGNHTISLQISGSGVAGDIVLAQGTTLTVIQLPLWDSPAGLITL